MSATEKKSYSQPSTEPEYQCLQKFKRCARKRELRELIEAEIKSLDPDEMRGLAAYVKEACYDELKKRAMARGEDVIEWDKFRL